MTETDTQFLAPELRRDGETKMSSIGRDRKSVV